MKVCWSKFPMIGLVCVQIASIVATSPCRAMLRIPGRIPSSVSAISPPMIPSTSTTSSTDIVFYRSNVHDCSHGFDASQIEPVEPRNTIRSDDISMIIPQDLSPTNDGGAVAAKIADRSVDSFFNSPLMKTSDIGRAAHSVERSMQADMNIGGAEPDSIHHNIHFGLQAAQTKAVLNYTGITHAQLSYQVAAATLNFEVREPMQVMSTDLVYNHIDTRDDHRDVLSVRWIW